MTANRFIAEVDAPEFGEGYTIRLDMDGQARLESEFGEFDFVWKVHTGLQFIATKYLRAFLKVALRKDDQVVKELPEIPLPLAPIAAKCLDAFCLFREGKDAATLLAENEEAVAKKKAAAVATMKATTA